MHILQDHTGELSFSDAIKQYKQGMFARNIDEKVSFGFTRDVIWASLLISNPTDGEIKKVFYLDTAWLDSANFYFLHDDKSVEQDYIGDLLPFSTRKNKTRMPSKTHSFRSGTTQVLIRFESKDPMLIPIYLSTEEIVQSKLIYSNYFYGFIYGAFFILLVYNVALSISLKDIRYVYYSLYLLSFLSLNIAYTGHGFKYIWSNSLFLQQWLMIFFLFCYIIFGIAFCFEFLKLKVFLPKVYSLRTRIYSALVFLVIFLFIFTDQLIAVKLGVALTSLLVLIFISLGFLALKNGHEMVKFFIPAVLMGAGGAAISAGTTWGVIPYNTFLFHSIEVGMLIEMFVLALALAFNLKEVNKARIIAEVNAQVDHLTELYNRRAFIAAASSQWHLGIRHQKVFSVILIDIDWFKKINDDHGHAAGDVALKSIACTLKQNVRKSDILARWGGEEFIIFLPNTDKLAAINLAKMIRKTIEDMTISYDERSISVTASFGVAEFNAQMNTLEDLIKLSDVALYNAKKSGRNMVCDARDTGQSKEEHETDNCLPVG